MLFGHYNDAIVKLSVSFGHYNDAIIIFYIIVQLTLYKYIF